MAQVRGEAWLTCVTNDEAVVSALVLAESLRRTITTRRIGVIISENVSKDRRAALRKAFDALFLMDEGLVPAGSLKDEERAKIYALSLRLFEKCVFVSANCLVLENVDKLFEGGNPFQCLQNAKDGSSDMSVFMFTPSLELCEYLGANACQNGTFISEKYLTTWMQNQRGSKKMAYFPENLLIKFSVKHGSLMTTRTHAPIIQFVDTHRQDIQGQLFSLKGKEMGLPEKLITELWMEIFHQNVAKLLNDPKLTDFHSGQLPGETYNTEPIAIIGMSCRYPGANTIHEFWNLLYQGEEGIREPPAFRWTKEHSLRVSHLERKTNAGFLATTVDEFDARFFAVSPKEAAFMDPQARLLHEVMWESLEDSGIDPLSLYGSHTGIFTGSWMNDYKDIVQGSTEKDFFRTYMGNSIGAAAARLSFLLGLTGPSIATESGCSSAIVALDLAIKSLRSGESNLALAGGVNLLLHPFTSNIMDYVISPEGRCKTFDAKANGFGRAEGCGVLVLKRLSDALRDRDNIWAMIRGSAVSQEGISRSLGTPTVHCEALAMQLALKDAGVRPEQVSFVETHGTGTAVGDPMEVAAIARAYHTPARKIPLVIGSVKTNVGHTESCSGITGIMKCVLAMQHELIPKHRNLETLNPEIHLNSIPAEIPMEPMPWPKVKNQPRLAGVSSFGITGTDGHIILQESPDYELPKFILGMERPMHIIKISGKSKEALDDLLTSYEKMFEETISSKDDSAEFVNAAYTANSGRASFNHRAVLVARNYGDALKTLQGNQHMRNDLADAEPGKICFLFTGQGSQYPGMARTLYETSPVFRIHFDNCDRVLQESYNLSIRKALWESDANPKELSRTIYSQTSIFCVEYCLLKLWESWGLSPDYVLGHSLGEFVAAVAAEILDFKDALTLVAERSRLIDNLMRGSMLVLKESKAGVEKCLKKAKIELDFAVVNSPEQTVVAGDTDKIMKFSEYCKSQGMKTTVLDATHAFHSRHMDPMLEKYRQVAETIKYKDGNGKCQYVSGMEGRVLAGVAEINAEYWVRHTREKVAFIEACKTLTQLDCRTYLEVGPQPILSSFVMMNNESMTLSCLPSLRKGADEWQIMLTTLGKLYLAGYNVDWKGYDDVYKRKKVSLPFHPFHRKSFWVESNVSNASLIHPLVGYPMSNASAVNIFQNDLKVRSVPYLKDHCIGSRIIFPGAGFSEMCLSAGYCVANGMTEVMEKPRRAMCLENIRIDAPLQLNEDKNCRLQVVVDLPQSGQSDTDSQNHGYRVKVFHQNTSDEGSGKWVLHASSTFLPVAPTKDSLKHWKSERIKELVTTTEPISPESFYRRVDETGLRFGSTFRIIQRYWSVPHKKGVTNEVVTEIHLPEDHHKYLLHPLVLDAMFQSGILTKDVEGRVPKLKVPVYVGKLTLLSALDSTSTSMSELSLESEGEIRNVILVHAWVEDDKHYCFLSTPEFAPIALLEDIELLDTNVQTIESVLEQQTSSVPDAWEETWKVIPGSHTNQVKLPPLEQTYTSQGLMTTLRDLPPTTQEEIRVQRKTERLIYLYILNAFYDLGWQPRQDEKITVQDFCSQLKILPQFEKLVRFYFSLFHDEDKNLTFEGGASWKITQSPPNSKIVKEEIKTLFSNLKDTKARMVVNIYQHLSNNLVKILKGEESALAILFPTDESQQELSADAFYQNYPGRGEVVDKLTGILREIFKSCRDASDANTSRVYRLLEVGSGTGSMSAEVVKICDDIWGDQWEYYYTDISQSFFIKAEKKFENWKNHMKYSVFNVEQSPLAQGIPQNYFDIVLATDVIHATRNLEESLIHLRQTLRPRGVIFFTETIVEARDITYVFGLLEGYWRYEDVDWRPHHCCIAGEVWTQLLNKCGFQSVRVTECYAGILGCITGEATPTTNLLQLVNNCPAMHRTDEKKSWVVFTTSESPATLQICTELDSCGSSVVAAFQSSDDHKNAAKYLSKNVVTKSIRADAEDGVAMEALLREGGNIQGIIFAWGMDVKEMDQKNIALPLMHIAKYVLSQKRPPKMFAITQGVHPVTETLICNPSSASIFGMMKSLKNESSELFVRCIDLDHEAGEPLKAEQILFEIALKDARGEAGRVQTAYREKIRYEPRFVKGAISTTSDQLQLPQSTERYSLVLPKSRLINDLSFDTLEQDDVGGLEIEVKIKAFALNFKDILTILKPSAEFEKLNTVGLDYSGVITKVGKNVTDLKIGDRVFGCNFKEAQLPSHLVVTADSVLPIPEKITFWEAATLPAVFATSYYCLLTIANMKAGDNVLIHTGSGGVGLSAIQLAKHVGANIITTAGSARKRAYLRSLGIQHVFHSRNTSYEKEIMNVTNGKGVDIVLNSITGPGLKEASLNACAKNARFVEMSKLAIWTPEEVKALRPDVDYTIVDLTVLNHDEWSKLLSSMKNYLAEGNIKPIPYVKFDALFIRQALQYFQKAKHIGKVVCVMPDVTMQDGQYKVSVPMFNNESTYLITGGLGGIGFEVCKWMLENGAQDIVLTGRNPPKPEIAETIKELNLKGCNVVVRYADVANFDQVKAIIDEITQSGKPLRGVQHCAGVLWDNMYVNQTWESFNATFRPKITGTWNLHKLTKNMALEHFVFYSSITALMGTPSQPNHAASNCFEDSFAHYRFSLGLPATSINWGQWAQVGCAKEVTLTGVLPVSVKRMLTGLEMALKTQKVQACFGNFESFASWNLICPMVKSYLDDRLWKQMTEGTQNNQGIKADQFWQEMDDMEDSQDKQNIVSSYLKRILRTSLRLDADENINDDANIQDLGVDSLMLIELKNSIQTLFGTRLNITANLLKNCTTVREIATALVNKLTGSGDEIFEPLSPEELTSLLESDCQLPDNIRPDEISSSRITKPSAMRTLLVTGATGQLGPYMISDLCKSHKSVKKIICIIRSRGNTSPEERLKTILKSMNLSTQVDMTKVQCVEGDVSTPQFGVGEDQYKQLCQDVDGVVHCAVKGNHVEPYRKVENGKGQDIRSVNIGGTLNVLEFAATSKVKQVYFASAYTSIFGANEEDTLCDDWPKPDEMKVIVENNVPGYQTSKYVCEVLMKEANARGIPCKIFRFPWITGDSQTGQLNYINNHYILRFMTYLKLKVVPSIVIPAIVLPVDICAELSLKLFLQDAAPNEIFNIGHPNPELEQEFVNVAKTDYGLDLEIVEYQVFADKLQKETPLDSLKELYTDVERFITLVTSDAVQSVRGYFRAPDSFFENKKLSKFIPDWKRKIGSSMDIIRTDLKYVRSMGFFEKLGIEIQSSS